MKYRDDCGSGQESLEKFHLRMTIAENVGHCIANEMIQKPRSLFHRRIICLGSVMLRPDLILFGERLA